MSKKRPKFARTVITIVLFALSTELAIQIILPTKKRSSILRGCILKPQDSAEKQYGDTLITSFAPQPGWKPKTKTGTENQPEIIGQAALLVDINSGNILYEKNANEKRPIASLVKIMTAVVALEHKGLDEKVYITRKASDVGENSMGLDEGEIYHLEELMYGLILNSGNDAAYAIAEATAGSTKTFVEWMNIKAKEIGLTNTNFADPSGLNDDTYSTPTDLVKLTRYALKNPDFRKIAKTVEYESNDKKHKYVYLYNQTNLLTTYPGVEGVKTGYTEEAGLCLVTYAQNNGVELVGIVLNSTDRKGDMILMLDHGFSTAGVAIHHNLL